MNSKYYQASEKASLPGIFTMIIGGIIVGLITSPIYVLASNYATQISIYLSIFVPAGYGFIIGFAMSMIAKKAHLRSPKKIMILSFIVGLAAVWLQWVFFYAFITNDPSDEYPLHVAYITGLTHPHYIIYVIKELFINGYWEYKGSVISGIPYAACWIIEASIISIIPAYVARLQARKPYSEKLNRWADKTTLPKVAAFIENNPQNKLALESGDFSILTLDGSPNAHTLIHLWEADGDDSCFYLTLENVMEIINSKKKETKKQTVVEYLAISPETAIDLKLKFSE